MRRACRCGSHGGVGALARLARVKSTLSAAEARRIALAAQGFAQAAPGRTRHPAAQPRASRRMATLQIDSVNVFARSHYMPLFSRARRRTTPPRSIACCSPARRRTSSTGRTWRRSSRRPTGGCSASAWTTCARKYGTQARTAGSRRNREIVDWVRAELADRGPLRPAADRARREAGAPRAVVGLGRRQERARVPVDVRRGRDRRPPRVRAALRARRARDPGRRARRARRRATGRDPRARAARGGRVRRGDGIRSRRLLAHQGSARA